jgi:ABC-type branched-subunit amino acid transport system ATPase component
MTRAIEGPTVGFGGQVAVDALTRAAPAGKITGPAGPDGSGRSTVTGAVAGARWCRRPGG